jgi:hypothetical protein
MKRKYVRVGVTHHACECPARDKKVYTGLGVSQVPAEMLCKSLYGRFRRVVCSVSWRVGDALFAARDDNGGGSTLGSFLNHREEGVDTIDYAK